MLLMLMAKNGLCLKDFSVSHMDNRQKKKIKNFKVTKNKLVVKISAYLQ